MRIDARNSSHCASACQCECARRISSSRAPGHAQQRVIDPDQDLADDAEQAGVLQQVVGLVDRAGLRVLERDHSERGLPAVTREKTSRTVSHGMGSASGKSARNGALAVGAGLSLIGDTLLHGVRA